MKDTELRGILLQDLYDHRSNPNYKPVGSKLAPPVIDGDLVRVLEQLERHGLADVHFIDSIGGPREVLRARISANGVDVIEDGSDPGIKIELVQNHTYNISNSTNVAIGNNNEQVVKNSVDELLKLIEASSGTKEEKAEAKGLLRRFLEHPLLTSVAGGVIGAAGSLL